MPTAPPSSSPSASAHQALPSRRDIRTMTTLAAIAMMVKIQVVPVANENAAPGLRNSRSCSGLAEHVDRLAVGEAPDRPRLGQLVEDDHDQRPWQARAHDEGGAA